MRQCQIVMDGWRIEAAGQAPMDDPRWLEAAAGQAVRAIDGAEGGLYHRSRHAVTYLTHFPNLNGDQTEVYVKSYNPPGGTTVLKELMRGGRASNVARMTTALQRAGFATPALLLTGVHPASKRAMVASARAEGVSLPELIADWQGDTSPARKRVLLRALGSEVARLHRAGFIHGDLTPFNIFVVQGEAPRFIFLDHDRTRLGFLAGRRYRQLRNLVQLGRFDLPGISNADRLRVFRAYTAGMGRVASRSMARRVARMLARRRRRDAN
jgi:hypothetical protein